MSELLPLVFVDKTRKCKGRGFYNADALVLEHHPQDQTLYLIGRVASTQGLNHGWMACPDSPSFLRNMAAALEQIADKMETE